jgi:transposase
VRGYHATWLAGQDESFRGGIEHAALDPFRGCANVIRDELPDAVAVLDAFPVVRLRTQVLDECAAASSRTPPATADTRTIRSTRSEDCCGAAPNT